MRMRKKATSILLVLSMLVTLFASGLTSFAASSSLDVKFSNNGNAETSSNTIYANFQVTNNGSSDVNLADLKLRYYYTKDSDAAQNFYCDHATITTPSGGYNALSSSVIGTYVNMSQATSTADTYLEVSFTSGSIPAGGILQVQTRTSRSDWSNYNMSNDYSFAVANSFVNNDKVTAYLNGSLISGQEPGGTTPPPVNDPTISPTAGTFDKNNPADLSTTLTANGNTFAGIKGLTKGTDYTVSGSNVTISKNYLSKLANGTYKLEFDFGVTNNPKYTVTVKNTTINGLNVKIGTAEGKKGDTVTVPITFADVAKVGNVGTFNFYVGYDKTLLEAVSVEAGSIVKNAAVNFSTKIDSTKGTISFVFLDNTIGDELITSDGVLANIKFKILGNSDAAVKFNEGGAFGDGNMSKISNVNFTDGKVSVFVNDDRLGVTIGTATGKTGETVTVPVTFADVAKVGNVGTFNFYVGYDSTLLKATKVEAGSIVNNAAVNFSTKIDASKGTISFVFLDNTIGDELITEDGVLANITFEILGTEDGTAVVKFNEGGAFGDGNMSKISSIKFTDGSVVIDNGGVVTPTAPEITPTNVTFDLSAPADVNVTLKANGNTFKGITGLTQGADYTVSGDKVTISKNYLSTLTINTTKQLTFDFGVANNPVLAVKVIKSIIDGSDLNVTIGTATGKTGETVTVPVTMANVAKVGNVGTFNFYVGYDSTLLKATKVEAGSIVNNAAVNFSTKIDTTKGTISFVFLDNTIGDELITSDGVLANITFEIVGKANATATVKFNEGGAFGDGNMSKISNVKFANGSVVIDNGGPEYYDLGVTIGTATGKTGETVTVPVTMANVAKVGNVGTFNFYVGYDSTLLKATKVEAGSIVNNAAVNFSTKIDASKGTISFVFLDNTIGDELITEDGVLANITFEILGTEDGTAVVKFNEGGAFGDGNMSKISTVKLASGSVVIDNGGVVVPTAPEITPTNVTFDLAAPADVNVTLKANGNTFTGITGLTQGADYTVSGDKVIISKNYLSTLTVNTTKQLTFDFGVENNPVLAVKVIKTIIDGSDLNVTIGNTTGATGDVVVVPITMANVAKVGNVGTFNFYVGYDNTLLEATKVEAGDIVKNAAVNFSTKIDNANGKISFVFLDNTIGDELITEDGVLANITFNVLSHADATAVVKFNEGGAFGDGDMAKITALKFTSGSVEIDGDEILPPSITPKTATFDKYAPADVKVTLAPNGNEFKGIAGLTQGTDYTVSGNNVTILQSYLSGLALGSKDLTFDFGTDTNPVLKLTIINSEVVVPGGNLGVTIGKAAGVKGDIITVPITFANVKEMGDVGTFNFYVGYDNTLLKATKVEAGSIVVNPAVNFSTQIKDGKISFVFLDNTIGDELITSDGVLATITFEVLGEYKQTTPIVFNEGGAFGDGNMAKITKIVFTAGSVAIDGEELPAQPATISPDAVIFDKYAPADIKITLTPNGNTFAGITGLTKGTDYTVSGNTVTLLKSYLSNQSIGTKSLTFDFGTANNPVLLVTIVDTTPQVSNDLVVMFHNNSMATSGSTIVGNYKIVNKSTSAVNLADVKVRYYFTADSSAADTFYCDHAAVTDANGGNYNAITSAVKGSFAKLNPAASNADTYLEMSFSSGSIPAGGSAEIQTRIAKADWSNYDMSNDYSYKAAGAYTEWETITAYKNGTLVFGKEPGSTVVVKPASITPTTATFDKYTPKDVVVTMTPNGNTFAGITGLTNGSQYTVSGNTVTIKSSYLATLTTGTTKTLAFDFGTTNNPTLSVSIKDSTPVLGGLNVAIGTATGKAGDVVTVPITFADVAKAGKVGTFNFYVGYDKSLLQAVSVEAGDIVVNPAVNFSTQINATNGTISFVFLDNTIGDELITEDGVVANIKFKVLGTKATTTAVSFKEGGAFGDANMGKISVNFKDGSVKITEGDFEDLDVTIGTATGKAGEVVTVPVTFADVAKVGNVGTFNFYVGYDKSLLQAVSVEAGSIVNNAAVNFSTQINATNGTISFVFLDNTIGDELITSDGVLANINFKVLGTKATTTAVSFKEGGAFGDGNMSKISDVNFKDGSVKITVGDVADLDVTIGTANGTFGDVVTVPVTFADVAKVGNVGTFNFYIGYDNKQLEAVSVAAGDIVVNPAVNFSTKIDNANGKISFVFLDNTIGDELITTDGVLANIKFKVLGTTATTTAVKFNEGGAFGDGNMSKISDINFKDGSVSISVGPVLDLDVAIGTATGTAGDVVTVPVTFADVANVGNVGTFNFYVGYDNKQLEAVSVTAGDIVVNPAVNFSTKIDNANGKISFVFLDNTIGDELIAEDGVVANINFKVLGTEETTTVVKFNEGGAFGNGNMSKISYVNFANGSVAIKAGIVVLDPTISPVSATFDKYVPADIKVTLSANGNTFAGITGLKNGTDYTVSGSTVTISKNYLANLGLGVKELTFDFGAANNPVLKLTVTDTTPQPTENLKVTIGTATGKAGDSITVPVTIQNVAKVGNVGTCNFYIGYDSSLLKATKVAAGDVVVNAPVNFSTKIDATKGTISFVFLDNTIGDELIATDGVLANITFEVLGTTETTTVVKFNEGGAFGDGNMSKIANVELANGSVAIEAGTPVVVPATLSATTATFDKYAPADITVTYTANVNTFAGITGLTKGTDYTVSGSTVTILKSYLSALAEGTKVLTFDFGTDSNPVFSVVVKDTTPVPTGLVVSIGKVAVNDGATTVTVPVTLKNVSKVGDVGTCNFYINYDPTLLKATKVAAGDIVVNAPVNFSSKINATTGTISFVFLDNTIGDELITTDGVLANITFEVLGSAQLANVSFTEGGAFGDGNMSKIKDITYTNGSVQLK